MGLCVGGALSRFFFVTVMNRRITNIRLDEHDIHSTHKHVWTRRIVDVFGTGSSALYHARFMCTICLKVYK